MCCANAPLTGFTNTRRGRDLVVLPGNHEPTAEFARWASRQLNLAPEQVLYTSGVSYCLNTDIGGGACATAVLRCNSSPCPPPLLPFLSGMQGSNNVYK
jgi:hypothetical protein